MIEVIAIYNREPVQEYYSLSEFHKSLKKFGYRAKILGLSEPWKGLMTKPKKLLDYLQSGECTADHIIAIDAWDTIFAKSPDEVIERFKEFTTDILIGSEIACFPEVGMACDFPHTESPFKYLNSGVIVGTPKSVMAALVSMKPHSVPDDYQVSETYRHEPNDQYYWQLTFHKQPVAMKLDYDAKVVLNCCGVSEEEMRKYDPCIFHFNGPAKEYPYKQDIFRRILENDNS